MKTGVLLLSGGLDSSANFVLGIEADFKVQCALTIDYGQRSAAHEISTSMQLCAHFGVEHIVFNLRNFSSILGESGGALLGACDIPTIKNSELDNLAAATATAKSVWVPNRNGMFINIAAALAEAKKLDSVIVGFNKEEAVTFADNSIEFMDASSAALAYSTANKVAVLSATAKYNKTEIVQKLLKMQFPLKLVWSCYEPHKETKKHCGRCESCRRLNRALVQGCSAEEYKILSEQLFFKEGLL